MIFHLVGVGQKVGIKQIGVHNACI